MYSLPTGKWSHHATIRVLCQFCAIKSTSGVYLNIRIMLRIMVFFCKNNKKMTKTDII